MLFTLIIITAISTKPLENPMLMFSMVCNLLLEIYFSVITIKKELANPSASKSDKIFTITTTPLLAECISMASNIIFGTYYLWGFIGITIIAMAILNIIDIDIY